MEYDIFVQCMEFLNDLINAFEDFSWESDEIEDIKRLEKSRECLRKAYVYSTPIITRIKKERN